MNPAEARFAWHNPIQGFVGYAMSMLADKQADQMQVEGRWRGVDASIKWNAAHHQLWSCNMAQKSVMGESGATKAGNAHEDGDGDQNDDTSIDQKNNAIGRQLAASNDGKADCYAGVMQNINSGNYAQ